VVVLVIVVMMVMDLVVNLVVNLVLEMVDLLDNLLNLLLNLGGQQVVVVMLVVLVFTDDADFLLDTLFNRGRRGKKRLRRWGGDDRPDDGEFLSGGRDLDLHLLVHVGLGSGRRLPVCRREDAEWDRDTGFKVQVGDFRAREAVFSSTFRCIERRIRRSL
jgi:hypothetical protein